MFRVRAKCKFASFAAHKIHYKKFKTLHFAQDGAVPVHIFVYLLMHLYLEGCLFSQSVVFIREATGVMTNVSHLSLFYMSVNVIFIFFVFPEG